jgi:hypothetical protein
METGKSTKPFSESCEVRDLPDLNLPNDPLFAPLPPQVSIEQMIERSRQLREWFPAGIPTPEERWRAKTNVVFQF